MKKFFALVLVFILFMCAVAIGFALMPPTSWAKHVVVKGVRDIAGLDIKINGRMSLSLVPSILLRMEDVTLTNPADAGKPVMTARAVEIRSGYRPLLQSEHRIEHVVLTDPKLDAEIGKDGQLVGWPTRAATRSTSGAPAAVFSLGTLEMTGANLGFRDQLKGMVLRLDGAKIVARDATFGRFGEAIVDAASAVVSDPANGAIEFGQLSATATQFEAGSLKQLSGTGATLRWRQPGQAETITLAAEKVSIKATAVGLDGSGPISMTGGSLRWREPGGNGSLSASAFSGTAKSVGAGGIDDAAFQSAAISFSGAVRSSSSGASVTASGVSGTAKSLKAGRAEDLALTSTSVAYEGAAALDGLSLSAPVLAQGVPVDATVAFMWNKERVNGKVKLPAPEVVGSSDAFPATFSLAANQGSFEFDGAVAKAAGGGLKGTAKASTDTIESLARWMGMEDLPATVRGPASMTGAIDAAPTRIALSNGRIQHGTNMLTGSLAVELGPRTRVSGKLSSDKLDANTYLGFVPAKPKPKQQAAPRPEVVEPEVGLGDVFKSYMRAMADAPVTRSGAIEIPDLSVDDLIPARSRAKPKPGQFNVSDVKFDLSPLRKIDLDVDWSVKQLAVRGLELNVPQLKTTLNAGTLTLEGRDLATKGGRLSGRAEIDARQRLPNITASLRGDGVELSELSEAIGITPMLEGATGITANLSSSGDSPKALVQSLSGRVQTNMAQGHVLGYDLGNITFSTVIRWLTGNREFDPERRTPVTGLKADLSIDKGVVRESNIEMGGPFLGVNAEGTVQLVEQRLDYRGRARIASIFKGLQFRLFGDLTRPTFQPDVSLASVFSRSASGEPTLVDMLGDADLKDPELVALIGRVLERAGPRGLDPGFAETLRALQKRAQGAR